MLANGLSVDEDVAVERAGGEVEQALLARRYRDLFGVEPRAAAAGLAGRAEVGIPAACELLQAAPHFNHRDQLILHVTRHASHADEQVPPGLQCIACRTCRAGVWRFTDV